MSLSSKKVFGTCELAGACTELTLIGVICGLLALGVITDAGDCALRFASLVGRGKVEAGAADRGDRGSRSVSGDRPICRGETDGGGMVGIYHCARAGMRRGQRETLVCVVDGRELWDSFLCTLSLCELRFVRGGVYTRV